MRNTVLFFCSLFLISPLQAKPVEIVLWHALAGHLGQEVREISADFNRSQSEFRVKPIYKGDYIETLTSFAAAFRAHQPPDIVQIFEVGTATMLAPKGIIKPVEQLLDEQGVTLPIQDFIPIVREFYSQQGQLMALPLNLSTPVIYYNADLLKKIGYTPADFPKTWQEMEVLAEKLKKSGSHCVYTSAHPAWILIESYLAIHGLSAIESGTDRAIYDQPELIAHLARLKRWEKLGYFRYGGRSDDAAVLFTSGLCPLYSQSTGSFKSLSKLVKFHYELAPMPLDTDVSQTRQTNVFGGAALWVVSGRSGIKEKGIAAFFKFITRPDMQKRWYDRTGYLPIGLTGTYATLTASSQYPALALAYSDFSDESKAKLSFKNNVPQHQIRTANDAALEALFAGLKTPAQALKDAVKQANHFIARYKRNTQ